MKFVETAFMRTIGNEALAMIEENVRKGVDTDGKAFKYGEKPFWRPYDKRIIAKLGGKSGAGTFYKIVKSNNKLGMIILGGYRRYKEKVAGKPLKFLSLSGQMMRNLNVVSSRQGETIIGFPDKEQAEKAFYLNVSGAGKSRKLWKFMGLRKEQIEELKRMVTDKAKVEIISQLIPPFEIQ